jgi:hypothetical protein
VIVGVGVCVGVFVAVGVFVGSGVFVGVGNVIGEAPLEILQAGSLNWIAKPKLPGPKLSGAFMNEPAKTPPQSTVRLLLGFAALVKPIDVVEVGSSPKLTYDPFHRAQLKNSFHPYRFDADSKGPQSIVTPVICNPG